MRVTSEDGKRLYQEGRDYEIRDGRLLPLPGGRIPSGEPLRIELDDQPRSSLSVEGGATVHAFPCPRCRAVVCCCPPERCLLP